MVIFGNPGIPKKNLHPHGMHRFRGCKQSVPPLFANNLLNQLKFFYLEKILEILNVKVIQSLRKFFSNTVTMKGLMVTSVTKGGTQQLPKILT
jgi:hypothetical protein